jgi:predicted AAA+ superfamily ATPase
MTEENGALIRETYLSALRPLADVPSLVKVVTGVRRSGKSVLLSQMADEIGRRVGPDRVLALNFELSDYSDITTWESLESYVLQRQAADGLTYVFLDEIQEIEGFERAVNSMRARGNLSIFISGSNSHLLSGELATYLAGRYIETRVWPLSFAEALALTGKEPTVDFLTDYLERGGMPFRFAVSPELQRVYLRDVFNTVVLRDVVQRTRLRDVAGLEAVVDFAQENLGRVMSPKSLSNYLQAHGRHISTDAIYGHLRALDASLLLNRTRRFDLRGKQVLATLDKYYATDAGLLTARRVGQGPGRGDLVENCVYVELARRGFDVFTGVSPGGEVDFVAVKDGAPRYIQAAYLIGDETVAKREFGAFDAISDHYPRFVISMDPLTQDRNGIRHLTLTRFLLDPPEDLR